MPLCGEHNTTHMHEDTCTVLSLTGSRQEKSNTEQITKKEGMQIGI